MNDKPAKEKGMEIAEKFLLGDMVKVAVEEFRQMPFAWGVLPEADQKKIIERFRDKFAEAVRQVVTIIAADSRATLHAEVDSVTFKDGIKAQLTIGKSANDRHQLADATGTTVLVVLPNTEKYLQGDMPVPEPDQRGLI